MFLATSRTDFSEGNQTFRQTLFGARLVPMLGLGINEGMLFLYPTENGISHVCPGAFTRVLVTKASVSLACPQSSFILFSSTEILL